MKKYLITSPDIYTNSSMSFRRFLSQRIKLHKPEFILYRDKENSQYVQLAGDFVRMFEFYPNIKGFIHQDVALATSLGAHGVHLTSLQFDEIVQAKQNNLEVIVSTHTHEEVLKAEELGADAVTYSPIFTSPDKGEPKGIEDLKALLSKCKIKVFALGGVITDKEVDLLKEAKPFGFASIRYFD